MMKRRNRHKIAMILMGSTSWCYGELGLSHWLGIGPSHARLPAVGHNFSSREALKASLSKHNTRMLSSRLWALEAAALGFKKKNELTPWLVSMHSHFCLFLFFPSFVFILCVSLSLCFSLPPCCPLSSPLPLLLPFCFLTITEHFYRKIKPFSMLLTLDNPSPISKFSLLEMWKMFLFQLCVFFL